MLRLPSLGALGRDRRVFLGGVLAGGVLAVTLGVVAYTVPGGRALLKATLTRLGLRTEMVRRDAFDLKLRAREPQAWPGVRSPALPQWKVRQGLDVVEVATGFTFPVQLAFLPRPGAEPDAPLFYVNELHGAVKYVTRSGEVGVFADSLLPHRPNLNIGFSDEVGLSGLLLLPDSEDLLVTAALGDHESGLLMNHILRLVSEPGGRRCARVETLLTLAGEFTSAAHQIQDLEIGPDGKLYVSVGDAVNYAYARDLERWGGKILRMELDGRACPDNPFYDPARPAAPRSYVWALGLRNVFDIAFDPATGELFGTDNGENIDRLVHLQRGVDYCWDGDDDSTRANALFCWGPEANNSPCGLTFLQHDVLGPGSKGRLYVGTFGQATSTGRTNKPKQVLEVQIDPATGLLAERPHPILQHVGESKATVLGVAEGPDGLYFTDFFGENNEIYAPGAGRVLKLVASDATRSLVVTTLEGLEGLSGPERGAMRFAVHCAACHAVGGEGGSGGPALDGLLARLHGNLTSPAYLARLEELRGSSQRYLVEQRARLEEVARATADQRAEVWLRHHIAEPRFDNPGSSMPGFPHLSREEVDDLVAYLLTLSGGAGMAAAGSN